MRQSNPMRTLFGIVMFSAIAGRAANPIITNVFTADPAPMVYDGTVYLYVGQDEARPDQH